MGAPREPSQLLCVPGRRQAASEEEQGAEEGMQQGTEKEVGAEALTLRKQKRKGRAKFIACRVSGALPLPLPGFQERGSPKPAWPLAHPFSESLLVERGEGQGTQSRLHL